MATKKTISEGVRPMLVREAMRLFLQAKEVGGLSPRTVNWYKSCLDMFIEFAGDKSVARLTLDDGQRWILHIMHGDRYEGHPLRKKLRARWPFRLSTDESARSRTSPSIGRGIANIRGRFPQTAPAQEDTKRVVEVLTDEEKKRLIDAVKPDTWVGARMMVILALLIDTGIRVSELAGIGLDDIDYKQSRIKLHGKGDKYRFVPIGPDTISIWA